MVKNIILEKVRYSDTFIKDCHNQNKNLKKLITKAKNNAS